MNKVLFLDYEEDDPVAFLPRDEFDFVVQKNQYDLTAADFSEYGGIYIGTGLDQIRWQKFSGEIRAFLERGGRLLHVGHVELPYLPFLKPFVPLASPAWQELLITQISEHHMYRGVNPCELGMRHGVAGFYARGANPPPDGARIVTAIKKGTVPVDWEFRFGAGLLYTHAGLPQFICAESEEMNFILFRNAMEYLGGNDE